MGSLGAGFGRMGGIGGGRSVVDPLAPLAPTIDLQAASDTGTSSTDNITSDTTPTWDVTFPTGLLENDVVTPYDNGVALTPHTVTAGEAGGVALALSLSALSQGTHPIQFTHSRASHESRKSNSIALVVDTAGPTISSVALTSSAGADSTYVASDVVQATVTFNEAVVVTGTPQLTLNVGGSNKVSNYASGSGTTALVFSYTVQAADLDANGISIAADSLALNSGTIKDLAGNSATLTHSQVTDQSAHKVDAVAPTISTVALTSSAGADNTYAESDVVQATATFSEAVTVTGTPQLTLTVGAASRVANYTSGSGTTALVFAYTIVAGDTDTNGISIGANALALNGGTIKDAVLNNATITHSSVADNTSHKVDTTAPSAPTLSPTDNATGVAIGANLTATFAESIQFHSVVSITIKKTSDNSTVHAFTEADIAGAISISGAVLTINPATDLAATTEYYVQIGSTSIKDLAGNFYAGISSTTAWSFTTGSAAFQTTWTDTLDTDYVVTGQGYSVRNVAAAATITQSGTQVRVTFIASLATGSMVVNHASIVERSGSTENGTTVPTELLFSGVSGFTLTQGGSIVSDALSFTLDETKSYLLIIDTDTTADGLRFHNGAGDGAYYKAAAATYNQQTATGFAATTNSFSVTKIEVQ